MKTPKGRRLKKNEVAVFYLEAKGYKEVESNSRRYRRFNQYMATGEEWVYNAFVGKAGAVRHGRNISTSWIDRHWPAAWDRYQEWEKAST